MNTLFLLYTVLAHLSSPSDGPRCRHSRSVALPYSSFLNAKFTPSMILPHQPDAHRVVSTPGSFSTSDALANRNLSLQEPRSPRDRQEKQRLRAPDVNWSRHSLTRRMRVRLRVERFIVGGMLWFGLLWLMVYPLTEQCRTDVNTS
uniref:Uncharacterized protein n=1 Tax=Cacopsylla melanoneura TaxID=428564 RepID=A0A8D9DX79_9HEMI